MLRIFKKFVISFLVLLLALSPAYTVFAQTPNARNISVFRVDGNSATVARNHLGRETSPRAGQRLSEGNIVSTGRNTAVYLQLDEASILKMDESSKVQVGAARNLLSLTVQSGMALVDVTTQNPGQSLETRVGNVGLAIRGTLFFIGRRDTDTTTITMLSGSGVVLVFAGIGDFAEIPLSAGFTMLIQNLNNGASLQEILEHSITIHPININNLGLFELEEILARQNYLIGSGIITPEDIGWIENLVNVRRRDRDARRAIERPSERIVLPPSNGGGTPPASTPRPTPSPERDPNGYYCQPNEPNNQGGYITIRGQRILINATEVNLSNLGLTNADIVPLSQLTNVRYLNLGHNNICDLSPLAGLRNLMDLDLRENQLYDASLSIFLPQHAFPNLVSLWLNDNEITNLEHLTGLTSLEHLTVSNNMITNAQPLSYLGRLRILQLGQNPVGDSIVHLGGLTSLEHLFLGWSQVSDITPLASLTNLTYLNLNVNDISNITPLASLPNLRTLLLSDNDISNTAPLSSLVNLTELYLTFNDISNIEPLANLTGLNTLTLEFNQVSDITPLASLTNLRYLRLGSNQIVVLSPLTGLTHLEFLQLSGNSIIDISPLSGLASATHVVLGGNIGITDWSPLNHIIRVDGRPPFNPTMALLLLQLDCDCGCEDCDGDCYCDDEYLCLEIPYAKEEDDDDGEEKNDDDDDDDDKNYVNGATKPKEEDDDEIYGEEDDKSKKEEDDENYVEEDDNTNNENGTEDYYMKEEDEEDGYLAEQDNDDHDDEPLEESSLDDAAGLYKEYSKPDSGNYGKYSPTDSGSSYSGSTVSYPEDDLNWL